jgi:hypothetical protein
MQLHHGPPLSSAPLKARSVRAALPQKLQVTFHTLVKTPVQEASSPMIAVLRSEGNSESADIRIF